MITSINPATEKVYGRLKETTAKQLKSIVTSARRETTWASFSPQQRAKAVKPLSDILAKHKELLAATMASEIGKPVKAGRHEVEIATKRVADFCHQIPPFLAPEVVAENSQERNVIVYEPRGVAAVISPWNSPIFVSLAGIIPPLLAGNNVIWKPSEYASHAGLALAQAISQIKLPPNAFQVVIGSKKIGQKLVESDIDVVSLTGSVAAGKAVAKISGEKLRPVVLELGGKDPAIVLPDADLAKTAHEIVKSATLYAGQVCFGVERVYCQALIFDQFVKLCVKEMQNLRVGDPFDEATDVGPLSVEFQFKKVLSHIREAKRKGAKILTGGKRIGKVGYFIAPTVVTNVNHTMKIMREETFGPVLPIMKIKNEDEAIKLANDSSFGLTASIWTKDVKHGEILGRQIQAGTVEINRHGMSKAGLPWGGYKNSGLGRIYSKEGIHAFTNIKHIWTIKT